MSVKLSAGSVWHLNGQVQNDGDYKIRHERAQTQKTQRQTETMRDRIIGNKKI